MAIYEAYGKDIVGGSGGSGGGHTIQNASGTDLTQQPTMQFTDAVAVNDGTNNKTKISVLQDSMTLSDFEDAQSLGDGVYPIEEDDLAVIKADMVEYGNGTVDDALDDKVNTSDLNYALGTPNIHLRTNYYSGQQNVDVNDCPNGFYSSGAFTSHTPSGGAESLFVLSLAMNNDVSYRKQIAWSMSAPNKLYTRQCFGGSWGNWFELIPMGQIRNIPAVPDVNGNVAFLSGTDGIPISVVVHNSDVYPSAPFAGGGGSAWYINVKNASGQPITTEILISFVYMPL